MSNNFFRFKQFTVYQERCSMKVCTDACVFGAYIARHLLNEGQQPVRILDIGTGTGLLSLLLAQKTNAPIDAIEIDEAASRQAHTNFDHSPWRGRLNSIHTNAITFNPAEKYDCIISNPPFFEDDLRSGNPARDAAKHDTALTLKELLEIASVHLTDRGLLAVLLPYQRLNYFMAVADTHQIFLHKRILLQHTKRHPWFRGILIFGRHPATPIEEQVTLKDIDGRYTEGFVSLLEDYYLYI